MVYPWQVVAQAYAGSGYTTWLAFRSKTRYLLLRNAALEQNRADKREKGGRKKNEHVRVHNRPRSTRLYELYVDVSYGSLSDGPTATFRDACS